MTTTGTVDLPAVGRVKSQYVVVGVAGVGGIIAYAYWQRSRTPVDTGVDPAATSLPDPTLPTVTTTTVPDNTGVISTNAEWTRQVVDYLSQTGGWDASFVASTIGKFLARRGLTPTEEPVALAALAAFGQPPTGAPYMVLSAPVAKPSPKPPSAGVPPGPYRFMTTDKVFHTVPRIAQHFMLTSATVLRYNVDNPVVARQAHNLPLGITIRLPAR